MFTNFKHLKTKDEQSTSAELAEHALKVMTTLDEGIKSLDDMDVFLSYLHQVGASHRKIPNFNRQFFWVRKYVNLFTFIFYFYLHSDTIININCCKTMFKFITFFMKWQLIFRKFLNK